MSIFPVALLLLIGFLFAIMAFMYIAFKNYSMTKYVTTAALLTCLLLAIFTPFLVETTPLDAYEKRPMEAMVPESDETYTFDLSGNELYLDFASDELAEELRLGEKGDILGVSTQGYSVYWEEVDQVQVSVSKSREIYMKDYLIDEFSNVEAVSFKDDGLYVEPSEEQKLHAYTMYDLSSLFKEHDEEEYWMNVHVSSPQIDITVPLGTKVTTNPALADPTSP